MSSYNDIRKIKYTKNPTDPVSLHEYIIFEDAHAKEKYVVFKFSNNVNQHLFSLKFEVLQYNKDNELLEKSVVLHSDFVAEANELFVPDAKLKVNFECQSLEVSLEEAEFDRVVWSNGEFSDNSYRFATYAETVAKPKPVSKEEDANKKQSVKKAKNTVKNGFNMRNLFRANKAVFPAVFNVFLCVILIALVVLSIFYLNRKTGAFTLDSFIVKESSLGEVTVLSYNGESEEAKIPSKLGEYYVTKIADGAFVGSTVKTVVLATEKPLTVETGAFKNCKKLISVTSNSKATVTVMESAFYNCTALATFNVPTARLSAKCFDGSNAIDTLRFHSVLFTDGKLLDLFNGLDSLHLKGLYMTIQPDTVEFFKNVYVG